LIEKDETRNQLDREIVLKIHRVENENKSLTHTIETKICDLERLQQEFASMKQ